MKKVEVLKLSVMMAALVLTGYAQAGPEVQVTFKNNGSEPAVYRAVGGNGTSTRMNAYPKPADSVAAGALDGYRVKSNLSPDANYAVVQYQAGGKICKFNTTYVKTMERGVRMPKWNKSAVAEGGARCDVRITSVNYSTHAWAVEFTMR
ncbi:MAG TPA: hypothetical protein VF682_20410 [Pseudomonas sp.]